MCQSCDIHVEGLWSHLREGQVYETPADGVPFTVSRVGEEKIHIMPQDIDITQGAFSAALHYLRTNGHTDRESACEIRSSNSPTAAGPLCQAARAVYGGQRCVNYVLPILERFGIVAVDPVVPSRTWTTP